MAETMKLNDILSDLQNIGSSGVEKTAQVTSPTGQNVKTAKDELVQALNDAMTAPKTAAAKGDQTPVTDKVMKIASDLADSEGEALVKEAHVYGAAVADGFMARIGQYEQASGNVKVASSGNDSQNFEKFASENPELTKQAVELGYLHGKQQIEQLKQASFEQGYNDANAQIQELSQTSEGQQKLAAIAEEINDGQTKVASDLEKWAATPEGQETVSYIKLGYADTVKEINKTASDVFSRGYNDTIKLLQAM